MFGVVRSVFSSQSSSSSPPDGALCQTPPESHAKRVASKITPTRLSAASYPRPGHPNEDPFCPLHDFYPPPPSFSKKHGAPQCHEECVMHIGAAAAAAEAEMVKAPQEPEHIHRDEEVEEVADVTPVVNQPAAALHPRLHQKQDVAAAPAPAPVPAPARGPAPPAPAPAPAQAAPAPAAAQAQAPAMPAVQPIPAWVTGDRSFYATAYPQLRRQLSGWSFRNSGGGIEKGTGLRYNRYICNGHLECSACGNKTRPVSSLGAIKKQMAKRCTVCGDEPGTLYRTPCEARAKKLKTAHDGVVKLDFSNDHNCSHQYGGGIMVKREPDDGFEDDGERAVRSVNVGALEAERLNRGNFAFKIGGIDVQFRGKRKY